MAQMRIRVPLDAEMVDGLLGSAYFHAGFRAFADPDGSPGYRLGPTPRLAAGDQVRWPWRRHRATPRRRPAFDAGRLVVMGQSLQEAWRRRGRTGPRLTVVERSPGRIALHGLPGLEIEVEVAEAGGGQDVDRRAETARDSEVRVTGRPARLVRLLAEYLESEGRDWQPFRERGIRPIVEGPDQNWLSSRLAEGVGGSVGEPRADGREPGAAFARRLRIRHPGPQWSDDAWTAEGAECLDGADGFDGAEGLAEVEGVFPLLARHTSTPESAFAGCFDTGGLALDHYGPGLDHSVAFYTTEPGSSAHPQLMVVPASQVCSPRVEATQSLAVFRTSVARVPELGALTGRGGADTVWPADHAWLLSTDVDWPYALLWCDDATAEAVLAASGPGRGNLEAVELD